MEGRFRAGSVIFVTKTRKIGNDKSNLQYIFDSLEINCWMPLVRIACISNMFHKNRFKEKVSP